MAPVTDGSRRPPAVLSIAGSDPSGGAGIQADLKTFSALGAYGMAVVTALTAQNTRGVQGVHTPPADFVAQQMDSILDDIRVDAVKIGMLATTEICEAVGRRLRSPALRGIPVVLDPVMVATSGDPLLDPAAVAAIVAMLPDVGLVTPNLPEAAILAGAGSSPAASSDEMLVQAMAIRERGGPAVLVKGGHLAGQEATDLLVDDTGEHWISQPRVATDCTHGTGCSLSSAITALRPRHPDWLGAVTEAKCWLTGALRHGPELAVGHGHGPVHHFHELRGHGRW
ncbi:MAG: bifunctional hydroxymethylpyrimidine kinase/phosphomethylpyrimidine kinase [Micrococcales bacterium]|nr:bifunctional hydroxymethylpyrimidine kinase/phosphomethylpyrimidine kinase [Micrococcales bacterium]